MSANKENNKQLSYTSSGRRKGSLTGGGMEDNMKLVPLGDRVVIKALKAEETTKIRHCITGSVKGKTTAGRSYCSWSWWSCRRQGVTMQVKTGDKVIYSKYSGTEVELDGEEYIIVKQSDILAIME